MTEKAVPRLSTEITPEQETLSLQPYFYGCEFSQTNNDEQR